MWDVDVSEEELDNPDVDVDNDGTKQKPPEEQQQAMPAEKKADTESESDTELEDINVVMERLPEDTAPLLDFARASQGILLLLVLKQHLKALYGFSDG